MWWIIFELDLNEEEKSEVEMKYRFKALKYEISVCYHKP